MILRRIYSEIVTYWNRLIALMVATGGLPISLPFVSNSLGPLILCVIFKMSLVTSFGQQNTVEVIVLQFWVSTLKGLADFFPLFWTPASAMTSTDMSAGGRDYMGIRAASVQLPQSKPNTRERA